MSDKQANAAPPAETKPQPAWQKHLKIAAAIIVLALIAFKWIGNYTSAGELPGCASDDVKGGLSNIFKEAKLEFSRYIDIKTLTTTKEEITCNATLAKSAGGTADFDYRIFFQDKVARVVITRAEDKP